MIRKRRKSSHDTHDNHERWLVSYADFITLLFAFFVVMYALSSVNEGKYRVLSDSLVNAFRNVHVNTSSPIVQIVTPPLAVVQKNIPSNAVVSKAQESAKQKEALKEKQRAQMRDIAREIKEVMGPLIEQGKVRVVENSRGVSVEISDSVLFATGQAVLQPPLVKAMKAIAEVLAPTDFPVKIEGHTDNVPIKTAQFPSNWELSAVRATTVLRLFAETGVPAERLMAVGYADTRPVEPNLSAEGRARNRRVAILIESAAAEYEKELTIDPAASKP